MFRPLEVFVGLRYLRARRRNHYISFISAISLAGIAVGVASLIIVLSVMNGFGNELRARLLSLTAHVTIAGADGPLADPDRVTDRALGHALVTGAEPYVDGEGLLINGVNMSPVRVRGLDPRYGAEALRDSVAADVLAALTPGSNRTIMGAELARRVAVMRGEAATIMIPRATATGSIAPLLRRFDIAGLFEVGIAEHDTATTVLHLADAAALFDLPPGSVNGVRVSVGDIFRAPQVARELAEALGPRYAVSDWTREQASIYRATRIEKAMMFVILLLIVGVAAFNIVATLVMVVSDKRTDIAILRTIGMRPGGVLRIFVVQGSLIGLIGTALGLLGGVAVALNIETMLPRLEHAFGISLLPRDVYYITSVPAEMRWSEVGLIVAAALLLSVLSTIYPARRAAATHPAEALRYE